MRRRGERRKLGRAKEIGETTLESLLLQGRKARWGEKAQKKAERGARRPRRRQGSRPNRKRGREEKREVRGPLARRSATAFGRGLSSAYYETAKRRRKIQRAKGNGGGGGKKSVGKCQQKILCPFRLEGAKGIERRGKVETRFGSYAY